METEKLIAALRCSEAPNESDNIGCANKKCNYRDIDGACNITSMCLDSADALERLTAENAEKAAEIERLKNSNEVLRAERDELHKNNCGLITDRDRLQAELDAAVEFIASLREDSDGDWGDLVFMIDEWQKENQHITQARKEHD